VRRIRRRAAIAALFHAEGTPDVAAELLAREITAYSFEYFQDDNGTFPLMAATSEIAGQMAVIYAAYHLQSHLDGSGVSLPACTYAPAARAAMLIFAQAPGLCCFCVGAKRRTARGICAAAGSRRDLPRAPGRPGVRPPGSQGRADRPDGGSLPQRGAPADSLAAATRTLPKHHHAHQAQPSITPAHRPTRRQRTPCLLPVTRRRLQSP
jgi:hypothetical protein